MDIQRDNLVELLSGFAFDGNGVVIGPPGVGKTFVLKSLASQLIGMKFPCLYLPIDKLGVDTESGLKAELTIKGDFVDFLRSQRTANCTSRGLLVIDAFDAARSETAQRFFLALIRGVIDKLHESWNVIVSVRTYDAMKSEELLDLFSAASETLPPDEFQMTNVHCRHFAIPKLTDDEIKAAGTTVDLYGIYERGSEDFQDILRIPFNLWLLEKLLLREPDIPELSSVTSEVQLLGLFWKQRVIDGPLGEDKRVLLSKVARKMVAERLLSVRTDEIYSGERESWHSLSSSEILISTSTTGQRVAFGHNILFDYAVSVLLIEDEPEKLVDFVSEEPSRPLFLRPSLDFYFTRLWHIEPDLFWKVFWHVLGMESEVHMRLVARLIPTKVIASEARKFAEIEPLFDSLAGMGSVAGEAIFRVLQALRVLEIKRDELWVQFLDRASEHLARRFAWDLSTAISSILSRAEGTGDKVVLQLCGRVGRRILEWIWQQREGKDKKDAWADSLGASWVVPIVVKTFGTDPQASRSVLEKILELVNEEGFPIQFLHRLTSDLERIWPYDARFAALVYITVFGHYETSEEKVSMGSPIVPMSTTRRQDYEMCQYNLAEHFPGFLRAAPVPATRAVVDCLNRYIMARHVFGHLKEGVELDDLPEKFQFRGKIACYIPDGSCVWDNGSGYVEEPIKMADELFEFIGELASVQENSVDILDSLLDVLRDRAWVAFFWRRLLRIASQVPGVFAQRLFELCIARPIQIGMDTLYEIGLFLEVAACHFADTQLLQIEQSIVTLPEEVE